MSASLKDVILDMDDDKWLPLCNQKGTAIPGQSLCRYVHVISDYEKPFTIIIQRQLIDGQETLAIDDGGLEMQAGRYCYRVIATNRDELTNNEIVHWYNQRAEDSENRIKELKVDFGGAHMPCGQSDANAMYFAVTILAFNLFLLFRSLIPTPWETCRAKSIRWRIYAIAAKVVTHGRQVFLKMQAQHRLLLDSILNAIRKAQLMVQTPT